METRKFILDKAYKLGNTALVDPVPELWDDVSIVSRADTMCSYFTGMLDSLESEYEETTSEKVGPQLESEIVSALEKGFEDLMNKQPGYHVGSNEHALPRSREEIRAEMEKILDLLLEERMRSAEEKTKDIWIEKDDALMFVKGVFKNLKHCHQHAA
jgi:hypothetical protein